MADPHRTITPRSPDAISQLERESRVETLLLAGLDHYFAGEYERAIGVWTRVLFLDRGHARARAYIERARSAVAERQRESEELLHRGVAAFERGEAEVARRLLGAAVERGGPHEIALAYLDRLDRLEAGSVPADAEAGPPTVVRARRRAPQPGPAGARRSWVLPVLILALLGWGAVYVVVSWDRLEPLRFLRPPWGGAGPAAAQAGAADAVPVPSPAEITLWRARGMFAAGRLREALQALETIDAADPMRGQADRLCSDIQRALLAGAAPTATLGLSPGPPVPAGGTRPVERDE
jgi:tetratricopeptide (TPR) repeat protein